MGYNLHFLLIVISIIKNENKKSSYLSKYHGHKCRKEIMFNIQINFEKILNFLQEKKGNILNNLLLNSIILEWSTTTIQL